MRLRLRLRRLWALLSLAPIAFGCAPSLVAAHGAKVGAAPMSVRCVSLDSRHRNWGSVAQGAAILAGGSGLATLPLDGHEAAQVAVGVTGVVAAVVAAVAVAESTGAAESFVRECQ